MREKDTASDDARGYQAPRRESQLLSRPPILTPPGNRPVVRYVMLTTVILNSYRPWVTLIVALYFPRAHISLIP